MRRRAFSAAVGLFAVALLAVPATPASATTATQSSVVVRSATSPVTVVPYSLAVTNGGGNGTVWLTTVNGLPAVQADQTLSGQSQSWAFALAKGTTTGTYSFPTFNATTFQIAGPGGCVSNDLAQVVVHDVSWSSTGTLLRLSASVTSPCGATGNATTAAEVRWNEPTTAGAGELVGASPAAVTTTAGTPVDVVRSFTNFGSAAVTAGPAAVVPAQGGGSPEVSVKSDLCAGKVVNPGQSCAVTVTYAPQIDGSGQVVVTVSDGRPGGPAGSGLSVTANPEPDQPESVGAAAGLRSIRVSWHAPFATTTNHAYDHYEVWSLSDTGTPVSVVANVASVGAPDYGSYQVDLTGLGDREKHGYKVVAVRPDLTSGPFSAAVTTSTAGRLLLYADGWTHDLGAVSIDPADPMVARSSGLGDVDHQAVSPNTTTLAASMPVWVSSPGVWACKVAVLPRTGSGAATVVPQATTTGCDTYPSFVDDSTLVFSRVDDVTVQGSTPYLVTYDLVSGTVTPVTGGAGLTTPAVAPDGSIVARDVASGSLARLAAGVATPIAGTAGATSPAVSPTGKLGFVAPDPTSGKDLVVTDADGANPRTFTDGSGSPSGPTFSPLSGMVYFAWQSTIYRAPEAGGTAAPVAFRTNDPLTSPLVLEVPDTTGPTTTMTPAPGYSSASSLVFRAAATDPGPGASGVATYDGQLRTKPAGGVFGAPTTPTGWAATTTSSFTLTPSDGTTYCVSARATDADGNPGAWSPETCTTSDRKAPVLASLSTPPVWNTARRATVSYGFTETGSGIAAYDVRYRIAAPSGGFGSYATAHVTTTSYSLSMAAGYEYCLSVRATDKVGNASAWSADRCTTAALDDRSLTASTGVVRVSASGYYLGTESTAKALGARLSLAKVSGVRIGVVVRTCPTCGPIEVYVGGVRLATLSTYSSTAHNQVLRLTARFSLRSGALVLRQSTSTPVIVDAVLVQHV